MKPNLDQVLSALRTVIALVGGWAVGKGMVSADTVTMITGVLLAVVPFIWGMMSHTTDAKLAAVEAIPEVKRIIVTPQNGVVEAALDPSRPKVKAEGV